MSGFYGLFLASVTNFAKVLLVNYGIWLLPPQRPLESLHFNSTHNQHSNTPTLHESFDIVMLVGCTTVVVCYMLDVLDNIFENFVVIFEVYLNSITNNF